MASLNQATIIGYVGDLPKISNTQNGRKVASFAIATTEKGYTSKSGVQYPDRTEWHNIVAWGQPADVVERFVKKGTQLYIEGRLRTRSWTDANGVKKYTTEINADNLQLLGRRENQDQQQYAAPSQPAYQRPSSPAYQAPGQYTAPSQPSFQAPSVEDNPADDLPF